MQNLKVVKTAHYLARLFLTQMVISFLFIGSSKSASFNLFKSLLRTLNCELAEQQSGSLWAIHSDSAGSALSSFASVSFSIMIKIIIIILILFSLGLLWDQIIICMKAFWKHLRDAFKLMSSQSYILQIQGVRVKLGKERKEQARVTGSVAGVQSWNRVSTFGAESQRRNALLQENLGRPQEL